MVLIENCGGKATQIYELLLEKKEHGPVKRSLMVACICTVWYISAATNQIRILNLTYNEHRANL